MIFVVGNSRSGTTMLGRVFGNHSQVFTFGELHFFEQLVGANDLTSTEYLSDEKAYQLCQRLITSARDGLFVKVEESKYQAEIESMLASRSFGSPLELYTYFLKNEVAVAGKNTPCEQTPRYLFSANEILENIPDAHMICLVRDPRDVLLSQKFRWKRRARGAQKMPWIWVLRSWSNYHAYTSSKIWASSARQASRLAQHPRFTVLRYEDLVQNPTNEVGKLCEFTSISYEEAMIQVGKVGSSTANDSPDSLGIDSSNIEKWKQGGLTVAEIGMCQKVAKKQMMDFGYQPDVQTLPIFGMAALCITFIGKTIMAILLNFHRFGNLKEFIRRRIA